MKRSKSRQPQEPARAPGEPLESHGRQVEDRLPIRTLLVVGGVAVLIFAVGVLWAWWLLVRGSGSTVGPARIPKEVGDEQIGLVFQKPFTDVPAGERLKAQQRERLRSYGWVDREKKRIHVPIEQAMEETERAGSRPQPPGR